MPNAINLSDWELATDADGDPAIIGKVYGKVGSAEGNVVTVFVDTDADQKWIKAGQRLVLCNNTADPSKPKVCARCLASPQVPLSPIRPAMPRQFTTVPTRPNQAYRLGLPRLGINNAVVVNAGDTSSIRGNLDLSRPCVLLDYADQGFTTLREEHANGSVITAKTGVCVGPDYFTIADSSGKGKMPKGFRVSELVITGDLHDWCCYTDQCYTGYCFNKPGTPNGNWIRTGKRVKYHSHDADGNKLMETDSGSVYRLVGPQLAALKVIASLACEFSVFANLQSTDPTPSTHSQAWCKITAGPLKNRYVGTLICHDTLSGTERLTEVVNLPVQRQEESKVSAAADGRQDYGIIEDSSKTKYILAHEPTPCIVGCLNKEGGQEGEVTPSTNDEGGRSGKIFGKSETYEDGHYIECSEIASTELGGQVVVTGSGSRYRVYPAPKKKSKTNSTI